MEARQLQQTLIVKQDDITQFNRDNERLLTEARLLLKGQATQQDRLERQTGELAVLKRQRAQSQTARNTLQGSASTLCSRRAPSYTKPFRRRANAHKAYR